MPSPWHQHNKRGARGGGVERVGHSIVLVAEGQTMYFGVTWLVIVA